MNNWDLINLTSNQVEHPEKPFVNFLARVYGRADKSTNFLDIGPGRSGRHTRLLEKCGFAVTAVDISHQCRAHFHGDINDLRCGAHTFDCILDIKTLCQERDPPYEHIYSWLKKGGYFFSMIPSLRHRYEFNAVDIEHHKDYTYEFMRYVEASNIDDMFQQYAHVESYLYIEPLSPHKNLYSWVIEAQK